MSEWIKCSERMPEPRTYVLVCKGRYVQMSRWINGWGRNERQWYWEGFKAGGDDYFDHWMPLPEPPKEKP